MSALMGRRGKSGVIVSGNGREFPSTDMLGFTPLYWANS
jgi:hypothetical protein